MKNSQLSPEPKSRASFESTEGTVGLIVRDICIKNGLVMRHVYDKMIISPPLIITKKEVDAMFDILDEALDEVQNNLLQQKK